MKKAILFYFLVFFTLGYSQEIEFDDFQKRKLEMNKYDFLGEKTGFWVDTISHIIFYKYFKTQNKNEPVRYAINYSNRTLAYLSIRENNEDILYIFDNYGALLIKIDKIKENDSLYLISEPGEREYFPYSCYYKGFYMNGVVAVEGIGLFVEDVEIDFIEYGEWKYYDKNGKLIKTKSFSK